MRIINNSKELTTLELGDKVVFGDLEYKVSVIYGYYLSLQNGIGSNIVTLKGTYKRDNLTDRNMCISKQEAEAFLALMQLRQLRKAYVKEWEPNWDNNDPKYCIICDSNQFDVINFYHISGPLSFPTEVLANQFLTNFKDLLEIAKPLL